MLLISCPECHRDISGRPDLCPNCGVSLTEAVLKRCKLWLTVGQILVVFGTALVISSMINDIRSSFYSAGWPLIAGGLFLRIWAQHTVRRNTPSG